jgi:ABC-type Fe3+/spermidine/putrescine transport system ATPase subunit
MQGELRSIQRRVAITALYVTHDQEEALTLSDRIVLMNQGRIEQVGTPEEVYARPVSEFAAGFIGEASFLDGRVVGSAGTGVRVELAGGGTVVVETGRPLGRGERLRLAVRPDRVTLAALREREGTTGQLAGTLVSRAFVGPVLRCPVDLGAGRRILAEMPVGSLAVAVGGPVVVSVAPADWLVVSAGGRAA